MYVQFLENIATADACFVAGEVYEMWDAKAAQMIRGGVAIQTDRPPDYAAELYELLEESKGEKVIFLPPAGWEFGHIVMSFVRIVHFHKAAEKVVCIRPGWEPLFPTADSFEYDWEDPFPDAKVIGTNRETPLEWPELIGKYPDHIPIELSGMTLEQEFHCIHADQPIFFTPKKIGLPAVDFLLGVRARPENAPERNWKHWPAIAQAITDAGKSFAVIGGASGSLDVDGQLFHTRGNTDAAIEALQQPGAVYVGTDSGGSHLASTVGTRMIVFRNTNTTARNFLHRMALINSPESRGPGPDFIEIPHGWDDPKHIIEMLALSH